MRADLDDMTLRPSSPLFLLPLLSDACQSAPPPSPAPIAGTTSPATSPGQPTTFPASIRALKARFALAWGEAPGKPLLINRRLEARAKCLRRRNLQSTATTPSIPHKPLIEHHPILREHRPHLALKIPALMMRILTIDIPHQRCPIAQPNGKRRIPALPPELRELRSLGLDPLRRRNLESLHQLRHRLCPRDEQRDMNVICNPANPHANVLCPDRRCQNRMHLAPYLIRQPWPSRLRAENQMHQNIRQRLRHTRNSIADLQPAIVPSITPWDCAPGYNSAGRQPATMTS